MKMRSTGLGKTILIADVDSLERKEDQLVLHIKTVEPVKWHVRVAIDYKDLLKIVKLSFNPDFARMAASTGHCERQRSNLLVHEIAASLRSSQ